MGYTPLYRDVETDDKNYDRKNRCSCIGFLGICVAMMIFAIVLSIPGMLGGSIILAGGPLAFVPFFTILFGPFVLCAVIIKLASDYREKSEPEKL